MASTPSWRALARKSQGSEIELTTREGGGSDGPAEKEGTDPSCSMHGMMDQLRSAPFYHDQVCHSRVFPERTAQYSELSPSLSPEISDALAQRGITQLYVHQAEAIQSLRDNQHVIVSTSTASGKSLIYQLPVLEHLLQNKSSKTMYIFPTKALAQDQLRALQELVHLCPTLADIKIATFDGDTPSDDRSLIRANASVIFTNPDMLHHSILPNATQWRYFLSALKYVVVDELHTYNGLFGANVAFIMRRLRRICWHYGNDRVQFVSCSATIARPDEHMKLLFGVDQVKLIDRDGAPCGQKGSIAEGALLLEFLLNKGVRTIAFCKLRKTCEMLMKQLRESLAKNQRNDILKKVMSYRGGYLPHERRMIERQLFKGELLAVVATNALELGVDIGSLDAVLMIGMPWSMSALWQQSGRAGRRNKESLSLVILDRNPLDQHYSRHPAELFDQPLDSIQFQVEDNKLVMEKHLQCAAEELPLDPKKDEQFFGSAETLREICEEHLTPIGNGLYRPDSRYRPWPAKYVNVRNSVDAIYVVIDVTEGQNRVLEEIEESRAPFEIYEGAIFIHQGRTFLVQDCNVDKRYCKVHAVSVDWTTRQRDFTNVNAIQAQMSRPIRRHDRLPSSTTTTTTAVAFGAVEIETVVFGYYRIDKRGRIIDARDTYMDPIIRQSTGLWSDIPSDALNRLAKEDIDPMASIHGAAHAMISLLPQVTSSSIMDIKTECKSPHATRPRPPRIVLYENQPSGIIRQAYLFFDDLVEACIDRVENCPCEDGCPSCEFMKYTLFQCTT
ncbi:P-loop containing nucleoside triphosphate hydrolase protein [Dichotomocladium elegans]|nr:P-loop containing nucleoside triphosphate hydrolase protein [Dichotomocladium elegans]